MYYSGETNYIANKVAAIEIGRENITKGYCDAAMYKEQLDGTYSVVKLKQEAVQPGQLAWVGSILNWNMC